MTRLDAFFVKFPGIFFHLGEGGKKLDLDFFFRFFSIFFSFLSLALHCSVESIQDAGLYIMKFPQNWHSNLSPAVADEDDERIFGIFQTYLAQWMGLTWLGFANHFNILEKEASLEK